ncbi:MAG: LysM peptidoglycan-binding domain-containing protein [Caldilineaceae bacterium]
MRRSISAFLAFVFVAVLTLTPGVASAQGYVTVTVQRGDSLGKIANRYCTTWQTIYNINRETIGPNPSNIEVGMRLSVPDACGGAVHLPGNPGVYDRGPSTHASGSYRAPYYTVAWGDTLYSIANRFGLSVAALQQANNIGSINSGQVIVIPGGGSAVTPPRPQPPVSSNAERVYFPGGISATRVGVISNGAPKSYVLGGRAGQAMEIGTTSHGEALTVTVTQSGGGRLTVNGENGGLQNNTWVQLPVTGDYIVTISPNMLPEGPQLSFDIIFVIQ